MRLGLAGAAETSVASPAVTLGSGDRRFSRRLAGIRGDRVALGSLRLGGRLGLGDGDVAPDIDPPAGQPCREAGVLALAADGQRQHPLGHGDRGDPLLLVDVDRQHLRRAEGVGHEHRRIVVPRDHVDLLAGELGHDGLDARATLADGRADRVEPILSRVHGHLRAAAGLTGDGLDLDGPAVDLGHLQLEQAAQEALVGPAHEDLRPADGAPDLEHERLDVLSDAVVLERALLGGGEDRLGVLADVEDDRARFDTVDGARDQLALAARELVEDLVALDLADALQDDLLGGLRADAPEHVAVELLGLDHVARLGVGVVLAGVVDRDLRQLVLDLLDDEARTEDADPTGLGIDPDVDVLVARDAPVGRLDAVLHRPDELLSRDLLLGVQLKEGAHEVSTHHRLLLTHNPSNDRSEKNTWGSPT